MAPEKTALIEELLPGLAGSINPHIVTLRRKDGAMLMHDAYVRLGFMPEEFCVFLSARGIFLNIPSVRRGRQVRARLRTAYG